MIRYRAFLALCAIVCGLSANLLSAGPINPLVGVNFQPYLGAWSGNPPATPYFNSYTYNDVLADLQVVKNAGYMSIKTYGIGTSPFSEQPGGTLDSNQFNVPAAHALGLTVQLGANLQFDGNTLNVARTQLEIDRAIAQAKTNPGTVKSLIIGNESIGENGVTVQNIVDLMNYAKSARTAAGFDSTTLPVTTVERWGVLAGDANKALSQTAEGIIFANIYPFFDLNTTITTAISQFDADFNALRTALDGFGLNSLQIAIGETGWAKAGTNTVNPSGIPSVVNAQQYLNDYLAHATVTSYMFEAFDEPWKANPVTEPNSVEPHFGILNRPLTSTPPAPAPEPSTLVLTGLGFVGLIFAARRRASYEALGAELRNEG